MKFEEALKLMREGKHLRRPPWIHPYTIVSHIVSLSKEGNPPSCEYGCDTFTTEDIMAEDWEIVDET